MNSFNKANLTELQRELMVAMQGVADKHGLTMRWGSGRFDQQTFTGKLEVKCKSVTGETAESAFFKANIHRYPFAHGGQFVYLSPSDLGRKFTCNGLVYEITGLRNCRSKYCIFGKAVATGKGLVFTGETVIRNLLPIA